MVFSVVKNRICFRGNTWEENLFPDNNNKVSSSGRKPEEPGSNLRHPRRPRGSQSGREKRRDESFQAWAEEPLGTFLGDPGAVSRVGKGGTKVCKYGQKLSSRLLSRPDCWLPLGFFEDAWVPTLTGSFPNGQANAGSWLGTKNCFVLLCPIGKKSSLIAVVYEQRRWRLRKPLLKVVLLLALSRLFHFVHFVNCWQFFLELNSERLYQ